MYQYTVIKDVSDPERPRFHPAWRTKDGQEWQPFLILGRSVSFELREEAIHFIEQKPKDKGWCNTEA